jgi:pimeloyl-ACP methyl ester carboxylesterase
MPMTRVNDIDMNYKLEGDGPETIVLINGLADDLENWAFQVDDFLGAGYRVLRFDNRGIGASSKPAGPYSSRMLADDAKALVDSLGITDFHLMGVSMGGMIAQEYALAYAGDLRTTTFACTYAAPGRARLGRRQQERRHQRRRGDRDRSPDRCAAHVFTPPGHYLAAEGRRRQRSWCHRPLDGPPQGPVTIRRRPARRDLGRDRAPAKPGRVMRRKQGTAQRQRLPEDPAPARRWPGVAGANASPRQSLFPAKRLARDHGCLAAGVIPY